MPTMTTVPPSSGPPGISGRSDACAGCQRTGVQLLANDDESVPSTGAPNVKPRFCAECMIGKKVRVFWPVDSSWYTGTVQQYDPSTGEHLLRYDDDDTEWVKIGESGSAGPSTANQRGSGSPLGLAGRVSPMSPKRARAKEESPMPFPGDPHPTPERMWHGNVPPMGRPGPPTQPYPPYGMPPNAPPGHPGMYPYPVMPPYPPYPYPGMSPYPPSLPREPARPDPSASSRPAAAVAGSVGSSPDRDGKKKPRIWTKDEDALLLSLVQTMRMPMKWSVVAQSLTDRTGKQCRERYVNHLNPRLKMVDWSPLEDAMIFHLYNTMGSHWAKMAKIIVGRTDNGIKNRFHNLRRQLEREDDHRMRLSKTADFPDEIRLDLLREFPREMQGKCDSLWNIERGIGILSAQSVLGSGIPRNSGYFGPFHTPKTAEQCVRCGLYAPSLHCGRLMCQKTGWCQSCTRLPPHVCGNLLRECLNLRRIESKENRGRVDDQKVDP